MEKQITIIITEDKENVRRTIRLALEDHNIKTIGEAEHGIALQKLLETLTPDIILLDLQMPIMDGNSTMRWLTEIRPEIKVIIMSFHDEKMLMEDYLLRGAKGCLSKDFDITKLVTAIRKVHKGGIYFNTLNDRSSVKFSIRQKEIISLVSEGKSKKEIATELGLTESAVDKQKRKIMDILHVKSTGELLSLIYQLGLQFLRKPDAKGIDRQKNINTVF